MGGESFYGEPFEDEIHGRLRFNRCVKSVSMLGRDVDRRMYIGVGWWAWPIVVNVIPIHPNSSSP
jgi:hypothetical protein